MGTPAEGTNRISRSRRLRPGSFSSEETLPCSKSPADREGDHAHPPAGQSAELSAACEPAALLERLIEIFLSANEGPVASGRGAAAIKATLAYILAMDIAVRDLWALRRTQVSDRTSCPERTAQVGASILNPLPVPGIRRRLRPCCRSKSNGHAKAPPDPVGPW